MSPTQPHLPAEVFGTLATCNARTPRCMLPGDTIPAMFWNAVKRARRARSGCARRNLGHLARLELEPDRRRPCARLPAACWRWGLAHGECVSILSNTVIEWVLADLAVLSCGGVSNGIYPTDAASQVHYLCEDSRSGGAVRRRRRATRQGAGSARRSCRCCARSWCSTWKACATWPTPGRDQPGRPARAGPRLAAAHSDELAQRVACLPARRPGHPGLHLGHHRQAQGCDAQPPWAGVHGARLQHAGGPAGERDERMCFLPLCHIAERMGGEYHALYTGSILNFVENPETVPENVREIAPTVFTAVPRVWEKFYSGVMIALKEASGPQQAAYAWGIGVGMQIADKVLAGSRSTRSSCAEVPAGALAGAGQRAQAHRHPPRALSGHRRGAHFARARQVVPGAGRADARGVGHDGVVRRLHRRAATAHEAGLDRPGGAATTRCAWTPPPANCWCAAPTSSWAT